MNKFKDFNYCFGLLNKFGFINLTMISDGFSYTEASIYSDLWLLCYSKDFSPIEISESDLSKMCRSSIRNVKRCIRNLEDRGMINVDRSGRVNKYTICDKDKYGHSISIYTN